MFFKKISSVLLLAFMLVVASACGSSDGTGPPNEATPDISNDGYSPLDDISFESDIASVLRLIGVEKIIDVEVEDTADSIYTRDVYVDTDKCKLFVGLLDSEPTVFEVFTVNKNDFVGIEYYPIDVTDYKGRQMWDVYEYGTDKLIKEADPATKEEGYHDEIEEHLNRQEAERQKKFEEDLEKLKQDIDAIPLG